jgi:hypothetical protein
LWKLKVAVVFAQSMMSVAKSLPQVVREELEVAEVAEEI